MRKRDKVKKFKVIITFLENIFRFLPKKICYLILSYCRNLQGNIGFLLRYLALTRLTKKCGSNIAIFPGVYLHRLENLIIGSNVSIHSMCYIDAIGGITIGDDVSIAHNSSILSEEHNYNDLTKNIKDQGCSYKFTEIENNVWIGAGVRILAGSTIKTGNVIAAGSVVKNTIESNSLYAGIPAKLIKKRGL
ncbi:acyltransferase [Exiguobacterium sp. Leaf196]|jgi:acetyltransferase-like isoleucine patch superfamily enzyme|uniref:acyltransferase n=1 Tax=Exiguobacterium sp. Leaf196 TaxID=1736298 RepID=UPI000840FE70|nr:acyltransferase [Exiguobacterium sp. Leaf196]